MTVKIIMINNSVCLCHVVVLHHHSIIHCHVFFLKHTLGVLYTVTDAIQTYCASRAFSHMTYLVKASAACAYIIKFRRMQNHTFNFYLELSIVDSTFVVILEFEVFYSGRTLLVEVRVHLDLILKYKLLLCQNAAATCAANISEDRTSLHRIRNSTLNVESPSFLHIALVQYNANVSGPAQVREILPNGSVVVPNSLYVSRAHAIHSSQAKMRPSRTKKMPTSALHSSYSRGGYSSSSTRSRRPRRKQIASSYREPSDVSNSPYYSSHLATSGSRRLHSRTSSRSSSNSGNYALASPYRSSASRHGSREKKQGNSRALSRQGGRQSSRARSRQSSRQGNRLRARPNTTMSSSRSRGSQQSHSKSIAPIASPSRNFKSYERGNASFAFCGEPFSVRATAKYARW